MSKTISIAVFLIAVILFAAVMTFTYREVDFNHLLSQISTTDLSWLLLLGLGFHLSFGVIMWVGFWLHYKLKVKPVEILTLPLMMHLFLYLMPMKGGMLFQVFYSKHKYKLDLGKGFSLGMTVFFSSVLLTVFLGIGLLYLIPIESIELKMTLWLIGLGFLGMLVGINLIPKNLPRSNGIFAKIVGFLMNVRLQLAEQLKNWKLLIGLLTTTFVSVIVQAILFWQTGEILGIHSSFLPVLLIVLILRIVLLVRLLPGNLGIQEIMIGATFAAAGFELQDGLIIGIMTRLISVFWSAVIGLPALYSNLKYFHIGNDGLSKLISKVSRSKE